MNRHEERKVIDQAIASVKRGRGTSIWIEGEPGIGKSALLRVCLDGVDASDCRIFHATADKLTSRFPTQVLADALNVGSSRPGTSPAASASSALNAGQGLPTVHAPGVAGPSSRTDEVREEPWLFGEPMMAGMEAILSRVDDLCAARPVILAIDDIHLADEASLLLWSRLVVAAGQLALLLVATCRGIPVRPEVTQLRRLVANHSGRILDLPPLSPADSMELAGQLLGEPAGAPIRNLVAAAAGLR